MPDRKRLNRIWLYLAGIMTRRLSFLIRQHLSLGPDQKNHPSAHMLCASNTPVEPLDRAPGRFVLPADPTRVSSLIKLSQEIGMIKDVPTRFSPGRDVADLNMTYAVRHCRPCGRDIARDFVSVVGVELENKVLCAHRI